MDELTERDDVGAELHARRAQSFGAQASAYARHRPDYPARAVQWALEPVRERDTVRVLDLGAGTGKLTEVLVRQGVAVTAVEPDAAMRAELGRRLPMVVALAGSAEEIPLPDATLDAVLVGQAFHWFDQERALPEIARVLRPGGVLAALWNHDDDRVDWVAGLAETSGIGVRYTEHQDWTLEGTGLFGTLFDAQQKVEFTHAHRRTADSLTATVSTHSMALLLHEPERSELLERVRGYLRSRPETATGEFDLPIVTTVVRATRH